jgi:HSP20 family protein
MRKRFLLCSAQGFGEPYWQPLADIYRVRRGWLIKVDLAGVRLEDIEILRKGHCLTIQGMRRDFLEEESPNYYSLEISYNRFKKQLELPVELEDAEITVSYKDGMLLIRLDKEVEENG